MRSNVTVDGLYLSLSSENQEEEEDSILYFRIGILFESSRTLRNLLEENNYPQHLRATLLSR